MTEPAEEGTSAGLLRFLEWAGNKGEMNSATADAWGTATRKVLAGQDNPETLDVRELDVEALLSRFENLNRTRYSVGSMNTYKSRFRQAVAAYRAWLVNEPWKPTQKKRRTNTGKNPASSSSSVMAPAAPVPQTQEPVQLPAHETMTRLVSYTVPLRPDLMVNLTLPFDLTAADASRLSAFVRSLAFTPDPPPHSAAEPVGAPEGS